MSIFQRLIKFYSSASAIGNTKTPLENFSTECLAGVLKSDENLLRDFVQYFEIETNSTNLEAETQVYYKLGDGDFIDLEISADRDSFGNSTGSRKNFIDLEISGSDFCCFIEIKVNSKEGENQLSRYAKILKKKADLAPHLKPYLIYCTKWQEGEVVHPIKPILWNDIAKFLGQPKFSKSDLIQHFLKFLNQQGMSHNMNFSPKDLEFMGVFQDNLKRMNKYIDNRIVPILGKNCKRRDLEKSVNDSHCYAIKNQILKDVPSAVIGAGFDLTNQKLTISFWVSKKDYLNFDDHLNKISGLKKGKADEDCGNFWTYSDANGASFGYGKHIALFMEFDDMEKEIRKWFEENWGKLKLDMKNTWPEYEWDETLFKAN